MEQNNPQDEFVKFIKEEKQILILKQISSETKYYTDLYDTLTFDELISLQRSNRKYYGKGKKLSFQFSVYLTFRVIHDLIPVIAITGMATAVMSIIINSEDKK